MEYYFYIHQSESVDTIKRFFEEPTSIAKSYYARNTEEDPLAQKRKLSEFLNYADEEGVTNRTRIFGVYANNGVEGYPTEESIDINAPLLSGTALLIPKSNSYNEILPITGKNVFLKQQNLRSFMADRFKAINNDPSYVKGEEIVFQGNKYSIKLMTQMAQVWIWVRSLNRIVNVTKFIRSISTDVTGQGGNFSMSLLPVGDPEEGYIESGEKIVYIGNTVADNKYIEPYFSKHIQQNDIVFIRFERLESEGERGNLEKKLFIEKSQLPDKIYDMIGLVDRCSSSYNSMINDLNVDIVGRDFTKLLIEDGAYFLPFALMENSDQFFVNSGQGGKFFKRLFVSGDYTGIFFKSLRSIRDSLGFIFNQLTNTGVLPDTRGWVELNDGSRGPTSYFGVNLFSDYPEDKIAKEFVLTDATNNYMDTVEKNGVWRIINLLVDNSIDDRRLANDGIINPNGSIMELVNKVCQYPFVEFWGDTYGDTYTFIARQPPFTKSQIIDYMKNNSIIDIEGGYVSQITLDWEEEYYSWYEVQPQNAFIGNNRYMATSYVPLVYFEEYVYTFGNHRMSVPCNYISYEAIVGDSRTVNNNLFRQAVVEDLIYVISSNSHLPFTRRGQIVIKGGDRRIKRGTFIRFKPTGEIFYVNEVRNTMRVGNTDIDRETVLLVSRGMIEDYIYGVNVQGVGEVGYFNIINTDTIRDQILFKKEEGGEDIVEKNRSNILVNRDVFNFFLERRQFNV